jgi:sortase A
VRTGIRQVFGGAGRVLVTAGVLILLFVAYQLWGTGIYESRAQDDLKSQFETALRRAPTTTATTGAPTSTRPASTTTTVATPPPPLPAGSDVVARLQIPSIGVDKYVVEGVGVDDLRQGPGHYPGTALTGEEGNMAIAGHRTTYGAPFENLDHLGSNDLILLTDARTGIVSKYVVEAPGRPVDPREVEVLDPDPDPTRVGHFKATLTLTTCTPKYTAAQRLVVRADLQIPVGQVPLPPSRVVHKARRSSLGLSGERQSRLPAVLWGAVTLVVGLLWWLLFHRHPRWTNWLIGAPLFLGALFVFYIYLERLLPSNY